MCPRRQFRHHTGTSWVVRVAFVIRVVLVIKFVNVYGLHGLNNQIIEKT